MQIAFYIDEKMCIGIGNPSPIIYYLRLTDKIG